MRKSPAFQFYPQDFLVGTAMMSAEEVGGYIRLLCYEWEHGPIPNDDAVIARLTGCGGNAVASIRHKFGIDVAGRLVNERLEKVRQEQAAYREKQRVNAKKRWNEGNSDGLAMPPHMPPHMPKRCPSPSPSTLDEPNGSSIPPPPSGATDGGDDAKSDDKSQPKPRARDPLFDALADATDGDAKKLTSPTLRACAVALSHIRKASPDVTPDEIKRRAANYRAHFRDITLTASALAKHWARCEHGGNSAGPLFR